MESNAEQFKKINKELSRLESNNKSLTFLLFTVFIMLILAIGYIIYAEVEQPLFGKWPEIAKEKENLEVENTRIKAVTDSVTTANNFLMENSPYYNGVFFEVQIGAFEHFDLKEYEQNLGSLKIDTMQYMNKYTLGKFRELNNALAFEKDIERLGITDAFIVAKINGERVEVKEAINAQKENLY